MELFYVQYKIKHLNNKNIIFLLLSFSIMIITFRGQSKDKK